MPDMRFAPPSAVRVSDRGGGLNQTSVRTYNERLVMSLLRQSEGLSRMEIGQISGLSAQTVSVIIRALERDNLCFEGEAQRGRVGPPSRPMHLNPEGAFSIGIKIGARSMDFVLLDFVGNVQANDELNYETPDPDALFSAIKERVESLTQTLPEAHRERIVGIGIAVPHDIERWPVPAHGGSASVEWRFIDFETVIGNATGLPVYVQNDITAAAGAEVVFGAARSMGDFAYFFIGTHTECRLVLNRHVYAGSNPASGLRLSSLRELKDMQGDGAQGLPHDAPDWSAIEPHLSTWVSECGKGLASAITSISGFIALDDVVVDGRFPASVRTALTEELRGRLKRDKAEQQPNVVAGKTGAYAKAIGAASVPLQSRFMVENIGLASP